MRRYIISILLAVGAGQLMAAEPVATTEPGPGAAVVGDAADTAAADAVLDRWIVGLGGADRIAALTSTDYRVEIRDPRGNTVASTRVRARADGCYRIDYSITGRVPLCQAFDGRTAWQLSGKYGFGYLSAAEHQFNLFTSDFRAPIRTTNRYPVRRALAPETVNDRTLDVVEMRAPNAPAEKWYFDPASGDRVRVEVMGEKERRRLDYSDFRKVGGGEVREAFRLVRTAGGQHEETVVTELTHNAPLADDIFTVPQAPADEYLAVDRIFQRHAAFTGEDAARAVTTRVTEQRVKVTTSGMTVTSRSYYKRPNLYVTEQDMPGMGKVWQGYDGQIGWAWSEVEGFRRMQGAELAQLRSRADMDGPLKMANQAPLRRLLAETEVDGRKLAGVSLAVPQGLVGELYFDKETGALVRATSMMQAGADGQLRVTAEFRDYRDVDGLKIPFQTTLTNPAMRMEIEVKSMQHNVPVDDALFVPKRE